MRRNSLALLLTLLAVTTIYGQSAKIKGRVLDSTGSVMPGVQIKLYQNDKIVKEGTSTGTGEFEVAAEPGDYKLELAAPDFDTYTELVKVSPDMRPLSITMSLAQIVQDVEVTERATRSTSIRTRAFKRPFWVKISSRPCRITKTN